MRGFLKSAQGTAARRHTANELARSSGAALDPGPVVRGFLKSAQGTAARRHTAKELARSSGGALDPGPVVRGFLKRTLPMILAVTIFIDNYLQRGEIKPLYLPIDHRIIFSVVRLLVSPVMSDLVSHRILIEFNSQPGPSG